MECWLVCPLEGWLVDLLTAGPLEGLTGSVSLEGWLVGQLTGGPLEDWLAVGPLKNWLVALLTGGPLEDWLVGSLEGWLVGSCKVGFWAPLAGVPGEGYLANPWKAG